MDTKSNSNLSLEEELKQILLGDDRLHISRIEKSLSDLSTKIGSPPVFSNLVSKVLNESFQELDDGERARITVTLGRLLSSPVKREIRNAQPEILQAIYPVADALVAKGVKNAVDKMQESINNTIKEKFSLFDDIKLSLRSLIRGKSKAALWIEDHPDFSVDALMLIDRQTGLVIAGASDVHDDIGRAEDEQDRLAGLLSALEVFAKDALSKSDSSAESGKSSASLKRISTDEEEIFLTSSPAYTLASRITGTPPNSMERDFGKSFSEFMEKWAAGLSATNNQVDAETKDELNHELFLVLNKLDKSFGPAPMSSLNRKLMYAGIVGVFILLFGLLVANMWHNHKVSSLDYDLKTNSKLADYPIAVEEWDDKVHVRGLVPSTAEVDVVESIVEFYFSNSKVDIRLRTDAKVETNEDSTSEEGRKQ